MKIAVIINPRAGLPKLLPIIRLRIQQHFSALGNELKSYEITPQVDGTACGKQALQDGAELLVAAGGDGTINRVAQAIIGTEIPLGLLPLGSGNGMARTLGIPLKLDLALELYKNPVFRKIDTGKVNEKVFLISCGFGLDAIIAHDIERSPLRGTFPYILSAFRRSFTEPVEQFRLTNLETGETWDRDAIAISILNSAQYGGGAIVAPGAVPDDGLFHLVEGLELNAFEVFRFAYRIFHGTLDREPKVIMRQINRIRLERISERREMHIDGEALYSERVNIIENIPLSLRVLVGPKYQSGWKTTSTA
ncbi:MAG: diacylglycerol kinase family lipid kinase [bacterium]|nr:diacylglycerol kinase family lipid kinase [bacterium]